MADEKKVMEIDKAEGRVLEEILRKIESYMEFEEPEDKAAIHSLYLKARAVNRKW